MGEIVGVDELFGAAGAVVGKVDVIAQEQEEGLVADEVLGLIDGVAVAFRGALGGKGEGFFDMGEAFGGGEGPVFAGEGGEHFFGEAAEILAELFFVAGGDHDADFLDAGIHGFFDDDLEDGFGEAVGIDEWEEFFLNDGGGGVLAGAAAGGGDDGFADFHGAHSVDLRSTAKQALVAAAFGLEDHDHALAFELGLALGLGDFGEVGFEVFHESSAQVHVLHLAAAEHDVELNFVAFAEEFLGLVEFGDLVVIVDADRLDAQFFELGDVGGVGLFALSFSACTSTCRSP